MLGVEESSFLVLESGQRLVPELVLEVEETVAVVQGKVLDLVQCQQWSAGGLGCLVGLLRRALSPGRPVTSVALQAPAH